MKAIQLQAACSQYRVKARGHALLLISPAMFAAQPSSREFAPLLFIILDGRDCQ